MKDIIREDYWAYELFTDDEMIEIGNAVTEQQSDLPFYLRHQWNDPSLLLDKQFFVEAFAYISIPYIDRIIKSLQTEKQIVNAIQASQQMIE